MHQCRKMAVYLSKIVKNKIITVLCFEYILTKYLKDLEQVMYKLINL